MASNVPGEVLVGYLGKFLPGKGCLGLEEVSQGWSPNSQRDENPCGCGTRGSGSVVGNGGTGWAWRAFPT